MSGASGLGLVVARERATLAVLKSLLVELGYEAEGVTSGTDAVREVKRHRPTVVVATYGQAPVNGYGLWALMQSTPSLVEVPFVLALTQFEYTRLTNEGREMPANLIIPFGASSLARAIERSRTGTVDVFEI